MVQQPAFSFVVHTGTDVTHFFKFKSETANSSATKKFVEEKQNFKTYQYLVVKR